MFICSINYSQIRFSRKKQGKTAVKFRSDINGFSWQRFGTG
ncbi:hypothetical protein AQPE_0260 [Aquipluma nitroreducens]|uniref:Uncharacterized protein n=1 Tax=Aquipluma nitroreducens TaxID=2010828 RepID=A0A5K7S3K4_9BACT|nr:hypothetical protein AQPE_0260 [Aquipluma nitroreducens]